MSAPEHTRRFTLPSQLSGRILSPKNVQRLDQGEGNDGNRQGRVSDGELEEGRGRPAKRKRQPQGTETLALTSDRPSNHQIDEGPRDQSRLGASGSDGNNLSLPGQRRLADNNPPGAPPPWTSNQEDMMLMLYEQQAKKRLMMDRQEKEKREKGQ